MAAMASEYPKPIGVHAKAILAALVPMAFAALFSWIFPLTTLSLNRVDAKRADAVLKQRMLGIVPILRVEIPDLASVHVHTVQAGRTSDRRTGDPSYYLKLIDRQGEETLTPANAESADEIAAQVTDFLKNPDEPSLFEWTIPLFGYFAAIPAGLSLLFLLLVVPDALKSLWYWVLPPAADVPQVE